MIHALIKPALFVITIVLNAIFTQFIYDTLQSNLQDHFIKRKIDVVTLILKDKNIKFFCSCIFAIIILISYFIIFHF
jgi:hypothetical protein